MSGRSLFKALFLYASLLIIVSLFLWLFPSVFLGGINGRIDELTLKGRLSEAEQRTLNSLQWSRVWWETQSAVLFNPIAIILFAIGVIIILYGVIDKLGW